MTIAQLVSFAAVAHRLSFRGAAEHLNMAQPSVSAHIHSLEQELGVELFERTGRRVRLTEAGLALVPYAEHILTSVEDARAAILSLNETPRGTLALATTPSLVGTVVPPIVRRLQIDAPHVQLRLTVSVSGTVLENVRRGDADLGIAYLTHTDPAIRTMPVVNDEFILIVSPDHPLVKQSGISIRRLHGMPIIGLGTGTAGRVAVDRALNERDIHPEILMEIESSDAIKGMVAAGVAPALVSRQAVAAELQAGTVRPIPFTDATIHHPIVAHMRASRAMRGSLLAGLRALQAVYPQALA